MTAPRTQLVCSILTLVLLGACNRSKPATAGSPQAPAPTPAAAASPMAFGSVLETIDAANYTYVHVKTSSGDIWAATSMFKVAKGDKVVVPIEMPMENFHSPSLKRTFQTIYFTAHIFKEGEAGAPVKPS